MGIRTRITGRLFVLFLMVLISALVKSSVPSSISTFILLFCCASADQVQNHLPAYKDELSLHRRLAEHGIVPDIFNITKGYTTDWLNVSYPSIDVEGSYVRYEWVKNQPLSVKWLQCKQDKKYLLMLADIDNVADRRSSDKHWYAWVIANIPGRTCNISEGRTLFPYSIKGPEYGIVTHRYFYFVWEQCTKSDDEFTNPKHFQTNTSRTCFDVNLFVNVYDLDGPVAANYFVLHYDY